MVITVNSDNALHAAVIKNRKCAQQHLQEKTLIWDVEDTAEEVRALQPSAGQSRNYTWSFEEEDGSEIKIFAMSNWELEWEVDQMPRKPKER